MLFTSLNFLLFFPVVALVFFLLPFRYRNGFLLVASYYFYLNIKPVYALLLAAVTLMTYLFARLIESNDSEDVQGRWLKAGVVLTLLPLFFFKYYNVVNTGIAEAIAALGIGWPLPEFALLLPVGISFYTFMAIGYLIDVYNEEVPAEKNLINVALFLAFFPLVLSGPIERASNILHQFKKEHPFTYDDAVAGLRLMLWGYFLKLVIAERVAIYLGAVFSNVDHHSGSTILLATLLYPVQLYGDLGGYSLTAIGAARIMGIRVIDNFRRPFFAVSMSDFWRRWHISLITWLTDYVYTPLAFKLRSLRIWGIVLALMLTFILSGIWHGAAITFVVWGAIQGVALSIEAVSNTRKSAFENRFQLRTRWWYIAFGCIFTYSLFSFSLIFGGAYSQFSDSLVAIGKIFSDSGSLFLDQPTLGYLIIGLAPLVISEFRDEFFPQRFLLYDNKRIAIRWASYLATALLILLIGVFDGGQFIYFQF